jgi:DNA-binding transcriptional LysR family regulator
MELRHLRYFLAVAEHLNFGRAAAALHTAQPSLSQQIRRLEQELGGKLFERTKRYVALTPLGQDLLMEAQEVVEAADRLVVRLNDHSAAPRGRLRVGAIAPATIGVLPRVLPSFRERFPLVELSLATVGLDEQVRALLERRIDVGILRTPVADGRIHTVPVAVEFFCVSVPASSPLARRDTIAVRDLRGATLIVLQSERGGSYNQDIAALLARHRVRPGAVLHTSDVESVFAMVASGIGLTLSSTIVCGMSMAGLVYRGLAPETEIGTMILACRRDRQSVPMIRAFLDHVAQMRLVFRPPG